MLGPTLAIWTVQTVGFTRQIMIGDDIFDLLSTCLDLPKKRIVPLRIIFLVNSEEFRLNRSTVQAGRV